MKLDQQFGLVLPLFVSLQEFKFRIPASALTLLEVAFLFMEELTLKFSGSLLKSWNSLFASSLIARAWKATIKNLINDD